ncbi:hypothetical protein [Moritella marina]|uniref:hypothetical protein n=1 Tax=Moritella marina TaxID=90736 RepID=UPI0037046665
MKIKLLAVAVAGILLSGCNDDNGEANSLSVQAFDPAVQNMTASVICTDGTSEGGIKTGYDGNAKFFELTTLVSPETCAFTFTGGADAVDVSNGKSMEGVTYTIPRGMVETGSPVTASPMTTLIAKELAATGQTYTEETAEVVLISLGLGSLINNGVSVTELLSNTEAVLEELTTTNSSDASLLAATTAVLSDVLASDVDGELSADEISEASSALTEQVLIDYENYPENDAGEPIYIEIPPGQVEEVVKDPSAPIVLPPAEDAKPVDPPKPTPPPTGGGDDGTGGTGGGSGD